MNGHWYCSYCADIVFLPKPVSRWSARSGVNCPVCHHCSCNWVPHDPAKIPAARAALLFRQMREAGR